MQILAIVMSIGSLVCWIMTLIKMFQDAQDGGAVKGVLGILCPLWAFVWGWMTATKHGRKNLMIAWTILIVLGTGLNVMSAASAVGGG